MKKFLWQLFSDGNSASMIRLALFIGILAIFGGWLRAVCTAPAGVLPDIGPGILAALASLLAAKVWQHRQEMGETDPPPSKPAPGANPPA